MVFSNISNSLFDGLSWLLSTASFYGICLVIYRLYFHPLSGFPGFTLAAATKWYEFYYDVMRGQGGQFMFEIDRMHEVYGPIVRINPDELHIKDPEFFTTLYGTAGTIRDKYPPAANMAGTGLGTFGTVQHHIHRQRRRAITALYSKKTVSNYQPLIHKHIEALCSSLEQEMSMKGFVELRTKYLAYSTDVICEYSFGNPWGLLNNRERAIEWKDTIAALAFFTPYAKQLTFLLPIAKRISPGLIAYFSPGLGRLVGMFRETTRQALEAFEKDLDKINGGRTSLLPTQSKEVSKPPTIFQEILTSDLPKPEKSVKRMSEEGVIIISAGSETIGRTLTCATYHLSRNLEALHLLRTELLQVMPDQSKIPDLKDLEQLPYLTAVIRESLRLACITASRLPIVSPNAPYQYGKWFIPAGTPVAMTPHKTMMDPSVFEDPYAFQPQRWLGPKEHVQHLEKFYVPFGRGHRMCLGINLAYAELYTVLATVLRRFDFHMMDVVRERDIDPCRDCFVGEPSLKSSGVKVRLSRLIET